MMKSLRTKLRATVVLLGATTFVATAATAWQEKKPKSPDAGQYWIRDARTPSVPRRGVEAPIEASVVFEVAYRAPKEEFEVVLENRRDGKVESEEILLRAPFRRQKLEFEGRFRKDGEVPKIVDLGPFPNDRLVIAVWLEKLFDPCGDGRNAVARVRLGIEEPTAVIGRRESLVRALAFDAAVKGSTWTRTYSGESDLAVELYSLPVALPDSEAFSLITIAAHKPADGATQPPTLEDLVKEKSANLSGRAAAPATGTRLLFRFVE